ncbi:MAG: PAS domain S-box protein, partial [Anaerolineae bacterium]|nr:PAS domain S-box protein [Anaerolineae bacterium]
MSQGSRDKAAKTTPHYVSTELVQALFEQSVDGIFIADAQGRYLQVNQRGCEMLGYTCEEMLGLSIEDLTPDEDLVHNPLRLDDLRAGENMLEECRLRRKDGRLLFVEIRAWMLSDGILLGMVRDITERKRTEEALRESEHLLAEIAANYPNAYLSIVEQDLTIGFTSGQEFKNRGLDPKSFEGLSLEQVFGEHTPTVREHYLKAFHGEETSFELYIDDQYQLYQVVPLADQNGQITRILAVVENITERKQVERELQRSNELLRAIIEATPTATIGLDLDGNVQMVWNPAAEKMLGWSAQEIMGRPLPSVPAESQEEFRHFRERIRSGLTLDGVQVHRQRRDGSPIDYSIYASPLRDDQDQIIGNIAVLLDITERKKAEETQRRLNRELWAISNCNETLLRAVDEQTLLNDICHIVCDQAGYRMAWVGYAENDDAKTVRPVAWAGFESGYLADANISWADDTDRGRGPAGMAIRSGEPIYVQDFATNPQLALWRESALQHGYRSTIALPLKDENANTFGGLFIYASQPNAFTPDEIHLLKELAGDLAFGIVALRTSAERKRAEEALREKTEELDRYFTNALDLLCIADTDGYFRRLNPEWESTLGFSIAELEGRRFLDFVHPDDLEATLQALSRLAGQKEVLNFTNRYRCKSGAYRWIEWRSFPRETDIYAVARDVTERKKAEMQILASEQLFRALVENSPDFIARYDRGFRRIYVNPAIQKLFGQPMESVLNKTPGDQSPVYTPQVYVDQLRQVIETATERVIEMPFRTAQGEMHWGHMRFVPEFGPDGQVVSVLAIGRDIHEIKEKERHFRMLAENFPDFVVRFDRDCRCIYVNPAAEKAFGMPAETFLGKTLQELPQRYQSEQNDALIALIRHAFDEGVTNETEVYWGTQMGKRIFEIRNVPEKDATGNVVTVLVIAHDITERRQAEYELRQNREAAVRFSEQLSALQQVTIQLSKAKSSDDLCRRAVELARSHLGFDRVGIWFIEEDCGFLRGSFGIDEQGKLRDERNLRSEFRPGGLGWQVFSQKNPVAYSEHTALVHQGQELGEGNLAAGALWDGDQVIGLIYSDNLICRRPITEQQLEILRLYATTLGHLLKRNWAEEELRKHRDHLEELVQERTAEFETALQETKNLLESAWAILSAN